MRQHPKTQNTTHSTHCKSESYPNTVNMSVGHEGCFTAPVDAQASGVEHEVARAAVRHGKTGVDAGKEHVRKLDWDIHLRRRISTLLVTVGLCEVHYSRRRLSRCRCRPG